MSQLLVLKYMIDEMIHSRDQGGADVTASDANVSSLVPSLMLFASTHMLQVRTLKLQQQVRLLLSHLGEESILSCFRN